MDKTKNQTETKGKVLTGVVVSTKNAKTVLVEVQHTIAHPLYKKMMRRSRRFAVHNELPNIAVGMHVRIGEVKPVSKTKHFMLLNVV